MATTPTTVNVVTIDTGPPGPHTGHKILRIANVEGGSGDYSVVWRPLCDLTEEERQKISCSVDYRDEQDPDSECTIDPPCAYYNDTATCCRTGTCGGEDIYTRYRTGETDRELIVTVDNIPQFAQNFGPPCQLIFHWTLTDNITGDQMDGCCGVIFQWRVITPPPLTVTLTNCNRDMVVDTSVENPSASNQILINSITGGVGPYTIEWQVVGNGPGCAGTYSEEYVINDTTGNPQGIIINVDNIPRFTSNLNGQPCRRTVRWTVRDHGIVNEFGNSIGRVETGLCTTAFDYQITNPPDIEVELVGCGDTTQVATGPAGTHGATKNLQIGEITGGSGNYTVQWNIVPTILTGDCAGIIVASVHPTNERILIVEVAEVPQFTNNSGNPCVRGYTATVIDNVTGVTETVTCLTTFVYTPTGAPPLTITTGGCGTNTVIDTGTCSSDRVGRRTSIITGIAGGSGDYTIAWQLPPSPSCAMGSFSTALSNDTGQGPRNLQVSLNAGVGAVGSCTYTATIVVTDNQTGTVTNQPCAMTFTGAATTTCPPLSASATGCGQVITYNNGVGASGTTPAAVMNVTAVGGSGSYGITWNQTPVSVSGQCYPQQVTQAATGTNGRSLTVQLTGIPTSDDNTATPCVRTYQYTVTDLNTGQTAQGTCAVTFRVAQATQDCSLTYTNRTCDTAAVTLNNTTPQLRTFTINGMAGMFPSGYEITWSLNTTCGGIAVFDANNSSTLVTTTTSATASTAIRFAAPINTNGSCNVVVTAAIRSTSGGSSRDYCGAAIACSYTVNWNTQTLPEATANCPGGTATITRDANSVTRTYSVTGAINTTGISWQVTGCGALTVTPPSGTGASFTVTYTGSTAGAGISGSCSPVVTVTLTGPGGSRQYTCTDTIVYDTRPPAITITSISNCGQSRTIASNASPRQTTFVGLLINHSAGGGGPYTYEWTRINQTGACSQVAFTPITAATQTITPVADVTTASAGSCNAIYQARVRDALGTWSEPVTCQITVNYEVYNVVQPTLGNSAGGWCCVRNGGSGSTTSYTVEFYNNGNWREMTSCGQGGGVRNWLGTILGDSPSNYEVMVQTAAVQAGGPANTWLSLGTNRSFTWSFTLGTAPSGGRNVSGTLHLRRIGESATLSSCPIEFVQLGINRECF